MISGRNHGALSLGTLEAHEVVEQGLVEMSLHQFYSATRERRFYCTRLPGKVDSRAYPAWQFVGPAPALLPQVLRLLMQKKEHHVHVRLVTDADELAGLSPAEVLAAQPFEARARLHRAQSAILKRSDGERLALVLEVLGQPLRKEAIG